MYSTKKLSAAAVGAALGFGGALWLTRAAPEPAPPAATDEARSTQSTPHPGPFAGDPATIPERRSIKLPATPARDGLPPIGPRVLDGVDPRLREGLRGEAPHPGAFDPPADPDRHRNPGPAPPPVESPGIFVRREGEPPNPAGGTPHRLLMKEDADSVDPEALTEAVTRWRDALRPRKAALGACFPDGLPALEMLIAPMVHEDGGYTGFVQAVGSPEFELAEDVEACALRVLDDVELPTVPAPLRVSL